MAVSLTTNQNILSPSGVAHSIRFMRDTRVSLYVHGAPGISKSAVARQEADRAGIAFIDFRLTSVAPEDIKGVPSMEDAGGMQGLVWTPPLVFPRDLDLSGIAVTGPLRFYNPKGNNGIHYCKAPEITVRAIDDGCTAEIVEQSFDRFVAVVRNAAKEVVNGQFVWTVTGKSEAILGLEEFNSAEPAVMAAAYQLVLDRRIGDYVVPDGVMIVAMGNRDGDKGLTYKLLKPVANRFVHIEMQINFNDWQEWAVTHSVHPDVVGYLSKWPDRLFDNNFASSPNHCFATPRSWEFVSKIISQGSLPSKSVLRALICGAIGDATGNEFLLHREYMEDMPNVEDIFNGSMTTFKPKHSHHRLQIAYSTCVQMCYALKAQQDAIDREYNGERRKIDASPERKALTEKMDNAVNYAITNFSHEVMVVFNRMAMQIYRLRFNSSSSGMQKFNKWASENRDNLMVG